MSTLDGDGVRVVLVGTGSHATGSRLPDVAAVEGTVGALRSCLIEVCKVRESSLVSLLDPDGPEHFLDAVIEAAEAASDVLLLYYVGHGVLSAAGDLHLATRATVDLSKKAAYQALPFSEITGALVNCRARSVVLILDCCYSGRAVNPLASGALLVSADRDEHALAPAGQPYTAFSGELIRTLREGVPTAPAQLKLQHLFDHLYRTMRSHDRPVPILRTGNLAGELVFAPNRAYRPPDRAFNVEEPSWDGECPYRGLEPYTLEDEDVFWGRDALVEQVIHRLRERVRTGGLTMVTGPSGSGKTSLLYAGVLPAILHGDLGILGSSRWIQLCLTPGDDPLGALAARLAQLNPRGDPELIRTQLAAGPEQARVSLSRAVTVSGTAEVKEREGQLVIVVDQFEELFAPGVPNGVRRVFVTTLAALATHNDSEDPKALVILGVRSDFIGHCARFSELAVSLENNHIVVGPMTTAELRSAITQPAEQARLTLEPGLVDLLLRDTGADPNDDRFVNYDPGALPLLSYALLSTWQHRRGNLLTVDGYREVGGVAGAVSSTAERTFTSLAPAAQQAVRKLLFQMVQIGDDIPDTRRRVGLDMVGSIAAGTTALEALSKARLVTVERDTVEITHEALIRSWPRLRDWINEDRAGRIVAQELEATASTWERSGRDAALLYRGSPLATARSRADASIQDDLSASALDFLAASSRQERRATRIRQSVVVVLVVLVLIATMAAVFAVNRGNRLNRQLAMANAESLAGQAQARMLDDPVGATQLALASWRTDPTSPAARNALAARYLAMRSVSKIFPMITPDVITAIHPASNSDTILLEQSRSVTVVTGLSSGRPVHWELPGAIPGRLRHFRFSPQGGRAVAIADNGVVMTWDVAHHSGPTPLLQVGPGTVALSFSSDGSRLVALAPSTLKKGELGLSVINLGTRTLVNPTVYLGAGQFPTGAWFTDNLGLVLVRTHKTAAADLLTPDQLTLRSIVDGRVVRVFPQDVIPAQNGSSILSCAPASKDVLQRPTVSVTAADTGAERARIRLPGSGCSPTTLKLTADGGHVVFGGGDTRAPQSQIQVVSLATGNIFDLFVPTARTNPPDEYPDNTESTMVALDTPNAALTVFIGRNTSILQLSAGAPDWIVKVTPHNTSQVKATDDGRYLVVSDTNNLMSFDSKSGTQLKQLNHYEERAEEFAGGAEDVSNVLIRLFRDKQTHKYVLTHYSIPGFVRTDEYTFPSSPETGPPADIVVVSDENRLYALVGSGRYLSIWDAHTHRMIGNPVRIGPSRDTVTPSESDFLLQRPGHPDQLIASTTDDKLVLWSISQRREIATIPARWRASTRPIRFDSSGSRLAVLTPESTMEIWDVDAGKLMQPAFPAPEADEILGFTADGYIATTTTGPTNELRFWDPDRGVMSGALVLPGVSSPGGDIKDGRKLLLDTADSLPIELEMTAQQWFDGLCMTDHRDFTDAERRILPPGVNTSSPCD